MKNILKLHYLQKLEQVLVQEHVIITGVQKATGLRTLVVASATIGPKPVSLLGIVAALPAARVGIAAPAFLNTSKSGGMGAASLPYKIA